LVYEGWIDPVRRWERMYFMYYCAVGFEDVLLFGGYGFGGEDYEGAVVEVPGGWFVEETID
jgi:hypothetical protein